MNPTVTRQFSLNPYKYSNLGSLLHPQEWGKNIHQPVLYRMCGQRRTGVSCLWTDFFIVPVDPWGPLSFHFITTLVVYTINVWFFGVFFTNVFQHQGVVWIRFFYTKVSGRPLSSRILNPNWTNPWWMFLVWQTFKAWRGGLIKKILLQKVSTWPLSTTIYLSPIKL